MARPRSAAGRSQPRARPEGTPLPSGRHGLDRGHVERIQRTRIVGACVQVVGETGAQELSVAQIVSRAGVSRRTFYELFSDCDECLLAAFDHCVERIAERVIPAYEAENRWQDRIRAGLVELLRTLDEEPAVGRLVFVEALGAGPRALEHRTRVLNRVIAAVDEGRDAARAGASPPPLTAEGAVGAVCSVLHTRLLAPQPVPFVSLAGPLMSMIVLPYLGPSATRAELRRPAPRPQRANGAPQPRGDLLKTLGMRITYRTMRVLLGVSELGGQSPYPSNREIGEHAGISDQGQISKLLHRLERLGLIENNGGGQDRGMPNAWRLTERGEEVRRLVA